MSIEKQLVMLKEPWECIKCRSATFYPDGNLRCDSGEKPESCLNYSKGSPKIYKKIEIKGKITKKGGDR